jgi:predicted RNase H-like nuclease
VDDLVVDKDSGSKQADRLVEAFDGHVDAGAKPARIRQKDFHVTHTIE